MKVFQDLYLTLGDVAPDLFIMELTKQVKYPWERDNKREEEMRNLSANIYTFIRSRDEVFPSALVAIAEKSEGLWYISNVVPKEQSQLSYDQYNGVLAEFYNHIVKPVADNLGVQVELTKANVTIEDLLSENTSKLLRRFINAANVGDGGSHPLDQKRWRQFLIAAHQENSDLHADRLGELFLEEGWSEIAFQELVSDYDFSRELLNDYDNKKNY